jgi:hypothetical protein
MESLKIDTDTQPTHVSLYTSLQNQGIGVNNQEAYMNTIKIELN